MRLIEAHIAVADVDRSCTFYSALLPHKKIAKWSDGTAAALVLDDGSAFGIWKAGKTGIHGGQGAEHLHFAFQIEENEYDKYKSRLQKLGVEPLEHVWPSGQRSVYFFDFDGHQGEFITCDWFGLRKPGDSD